MIHFFIVVSLVLTTFSFSDTTKIQFVTRDKATEISLGELNDCSKQFLGTHNDSIAQTVVILGSSTASGIGVSHPDSAWVNRLKCFLSNENAKLEVCNFSVGGYTTFHILPTGTSIPAAFAVSIDHDKNVTKALGLNPIGIVVNMPSNDVALNVSVTQQLSNYKVVYDAAKKEGVPVWICTTQPRNFTSEIQVRLQEEMADSIRAIYGSFSIDFWKDLASENGFIDSGYDSGDGVHLNDKAHRLLADRVYKKISGFLQPESKSFYGLPGAGPIPKKDFRDTKYNSEMPQ